MKAKPFKESAWFSPGPPGTRYPARRMPGMINGVYAIRNKQTRRVLYVGESHTRRLYDTIIRHLSTWNDARGPREAYHRDDVEIAWRASKRPLETEAELILFYRPTDNTKGLFDQMHGVEFAEGDGLPDSYEPEGASFPTAPPNDAIPF